MSKKKLNKHSIKEAQRAQSAVGRESYVAVAASNGLVDVAKNVHTLPIPSIKKDLAKDLIFAVVAVVTMIYLRHTHLGLAQLTALFNQ